MIIVLKTFVTLLLLVFGILLAIVVFGMAVTDKHLVEMEDDLEDENRIRERNELKNND